MRKWVGGAVALWLVGTGIVRGEWGSDKKSGAYCQILDYMSEPVYDVGVGYISEGRLKGDRRVYGKTTLLETGGDWEFAYYRDILGGDVDLNFRFKGTILMGMARLDLPESVGILRLDAGWSAKFEQGYAAQIRVLPGLYSDFNGFSGDGFAVPFSGAVIRSFNSKLSGIAGLEIRPTFERKLMPIIGLEWEAADWLRLEARLPESKLVCSFNRDWQARLGFRWESVTYTIDDERDAMTLEDFRWFAGVTRWVSDDVQLMCDVGRVFGRTVTFEERGAMPEREFDVDSSLYVRLALGGPF